MLKYAALCAALFAPLPAHAVSNEDLSEIRAQIKQLQQAAVSSQQPSRPAVSGEGAYNPAIALILSGTYGQLKQDSAIPITGFAMSANNSGYTHGFSLKESELGLAANIDPQFRGVATIALDPDGGLSVENAFVRGEHHGEKTNCNSSGVREGATTLERSTPQGGQPTSVLASRGLAGWPVQACRSVLE